MLVYSTSSISSFDIFRFLDCPLPLFPCPLPVPLLVLSSSLPVKRVMAVLNLLLLCPLPLKEGSGRGGAVGVVSFDLTALLSTGNNNLSVCDMLHPNLSKVKLKERYKMTIDIQHKSICYMYMHQKTIIK